MGEKDGVRNAEKAAKMKKHILIVSQYFYPESFRINDIARRWVEQGYQVTVLTGIPNYPEGKIFPGYRWRKKRKEQWNGVQIIRIPLIARGKSLLRLGLNYGSFLLSGLLWARFTNVKADVVFTFGLSPVTQALIGVRYAERRGIQHLLYVQDLWPESVESVVRIRCRAMIASIRATVKHIYKKSEKIFVTSPAFVAEIQKYVPDRVGDVIYWPQYAECERSAAPSPLVMRDERLNVVFAGNIGTAQGLEILPKTAKLLDEQGIRARFIIVGDGRNRAALREQVARVGVQTYFQWIERQPPTQIPSILAACDAAFVSFADEDLYAMTIPAKLQTYLACAMPILACARGETERIIRQARCGVCCPIGDAQALCDALEQMLHADRRQMSERALAYSRRYFCAETLMEQMRRYLCEAMGET